MEIMPYVLRLLGCFFLAALIFYTSPVGWFTIGYLTYCFTHQMLLIFYLGSSIAALMWIFVSVFVWFIWESILIES